MHGLDGIPFDDLFIVSYVATTTLLSTDLVNGYSYELQV